MKAADGAAALALLPPYVAQRTVVEEVREVPIPLEDDTLEFEQEVVEILAMDGEAVLAEAAAVIRVRGLGVCLGPFHGAD